MRTWNWDLLCGAVFAVLLAGISFSFCGAQSQSVPGLAKSPAGTRFIGASAIASHYKCLGPNTITMNRYSAVVMIYRIEIDGTVKHSAVQVSSGQAPMDKAALNCVSKFEFRAATRDGQPVAVLASWAIGYCFHNYCPGAAHPQPVPSVWNRIAQSCKNKDGIQLEKTSAGGLSVEYPELSPMTISPDDVHDLLDGLRIALTIDPSADDVTDCEDGYLTRLAAMFPDATKPP